MKLSRLFKFKRRVNKLHKKIIIFEMNEKKRKDRMKFCFPFSIIIIVLLLPLLRSNSAWRRRSRNFFSKNNTNDKSFNFISPKKNCTQWEKKGKSFALFHPLQSYIFVISSWKFSLWWIETLRFTLCLSLKMTQYWQVLSRIMKAPDNASNRQICRRERVFEEQFLLQFQFFLLLLSIF